MGTLDSGRGSLTDILNTRKLRTDLVTVIALSSDAMRRQLLATFEARSTPLPKYESNVPGDHESDETAGQEELLEAVKRDLEEIASPRTQGLRRAAMTHFDKWQSEVLQRLGEVLHVKSDAVRQARADAKAGADLAKINPKKEKNNTDSLIDENNEGSSRQPGQRLDNLPEGFRVEIMDLSKRDRKVVLESVLLLLLSLGHYTGHSRILMVHLSQTLELPSSTLTNEESNIAQSLLSFAAAEMSTDKSMQRHTAGEQASYKWKVGMATLAGAALIGVSGGLAAPLLAAGIGSIMGGLGLGAVATLLGPLATNVVLVGGLFGAYGGKMTGAIMEQYAREVQDFEFLPVSIPVDDGGARETLQNTALRSTRKLRVVIGISGSITNVSDFIDPWTILSASRVESFGLRWETDALLRLSGSVSSICYEYALDFARYKLLTLMITGLWPFGILRAANALDSPFAIAKARSDKAGRVLADALIHKVQGERPVTMIGFSLGARVIYSCLLQLTEANAFGLVESVILMGAPTPSDAAIWRRIRAVVSGRVINVYSANDFVLAFLYRATAAQMGIAGLREVTGVTGIENYDLTDLIDSHDTYRLLVGTILQRVGFEDVDSAALSKHAIIRKDDELEMRRPPTENSSDKHALAREDETGEILLAYGRSTPLHTVLSSAMPNPLLTQGDEVDENTNEETSFVPIRLLDNESNSNPLSMVDPLPELDLNSNHDRVSSGKSDSELEVAGNDRKVSNAYF